MSTNGNGIPAEQGPATQAPDHPVAPEPEVPTVAEAPGGVETTGAQEQPEMAPMEQANPQSAADLADQSYLAARDGVDNAAAAEVGGDIVAQSAAAARQERERLMPEYQEHYFVEDLPPINPEDPWNQGIYMRYRINQWRYVNGMDPVE